MEIVSIFSLQLVHLLLINLCKSKFRWLLLWRNESFHRHTKFCLQIPPKALLISPIKVYPDRMIKKPTKILKLILPILQKKVTKTLKLCKRINWEHMLIPHVLQLHNIMPLSYDKEGTKAGTTLLKVKVRGEIKTSFSLIFAKISHRITYLLII